MSQSSRSEYPDTAVTTEVTVRCTGHIRHAVGKESFAYRFEGTRLRDFLAAFFEDYDVQELLLATDEDSATAPGWAPKPDNLPGTWRKNPEGDQVRRFARVLVNGTFNEHLDGFDTELKDGDRVSLMNPFVFCF